MSLLGSIVSKILHPFGGSSDAQASEASTAPAPGGTTDGGTGTTTPPAAGGDPAATGAIPKDVDVAAILNDLAAKNPQKLDWKHSIVDLMKLLHIDSSLHARQELADELHYTGDKNDSAAMNIWLHKQVLQKLAENGGKVPQELLS